MNRKTFIERSAGLMAGILSIPAIGSANFSLDPKKSRQEKEFMLAAVCPPDRFEQMREILKSSSGFRLIRSTPARAIRHNVSAIWIDQHIRKRQKHALRLMNAGIPVLLEPPYYEDLSGFDALQKAAVNSGVLAGTALYHRFLPAAGTTKELLFSGRIGKLTSAQVQINKPEEDFLLPSYSSFPEGPIIVMLSLLQWLLAQPLLAIRISRRETVTQANALSNGVIMAATEDFPVRIATIPGFYDRQGAWNILFYGEKGQIKFGANNLLEIIDETGSRKVISPEDPEKARSAIRMCFNDFVLAVKEQRQPEGKTTDMLTDSLLFHGIKQSLQSGKGELLVELSFGKAIRL